MVLPATILFSSHFNTVEQCIFHKNKQTGLIEGMHINETIDENNKKGPTVHLHFSCNLWCESDSDNPPHVAAVDTAPKWGGRQETPSH